MPSVSLLNLPSELLVRVMELALLNSCLCNSDTLMLVCRELHALHAARVVLKVRHRLRGLMRLTSPRHNEGRVYCRNCGSALKGHGPPRLASLHVLPNEILSLIATHVQMGAGMPALLSYSRASQRCRLAVEQAACMQITPSDHASCIILPRDGSWFLRLWLLRLLQHAGNQEHLSMLEGALAADHATFLRRRGVDQNLVSAALRLECEVTVLLDALDEMGYLVETQGVEQDVLRARSTERRGLVDRVSSLRLHRDALLTIIGLDAVREARTHAFLATFGIQLADLENLRNAGAAGPTGGLQLRESAAAAPLSADARTARDDWWTSLGRRVLSMLGCNPH